MEEKSNRVRHSPELKNKIVQRALNGESVTKLARESGISRGNIKLLVMEDRMRKQDVMAKYAEWIKANISPYPLGTCVAVTLAMAKQFPELTRVRGHYVEPDPAWGNRQHWWLTTPEGRIIATTASQFPSRGQAEYIPWKEGDEEPVGKCAYCGEGIFKSESNDGVTCSETCSKSYVAYVNEGTDGG